MIARHYTLLDRIFIQADQTLRALAGDRETPAIRPNPSASIAEAVLSPDERRLSGRLMRVNHAGEVSAQALYQGQTITARSMLLKDSLKRAAVEEKDHLAWCAQRLTELNAPASRLDTLWYAGSFTIGAAAGLVGDRVSLGFLEETERQVGLHLDEHLERLPQADARSRAILERMKTEEAHHQSTARESGAARLPGPLRGLMRVCSKVMTRTAFWI